MVELIHFQRVQDQVDEILIYIIHLNDEVCLVYGLIFSIFTDFMKDSLAL